MEEWEDPFKEYSKEFARSINNQSPLSSFKSGLRPEIINDIEGLKIINIQECVQESGGDSYLKIKHPKTK